MRGFYHDFNDLPHILVSKYLPVQPKPGEKYMLYDGAGDYVDHVCDAEYTIPDTSLVHRRILGNTMLATITSEGEPVFSPSFLKYDIKLDISSWVPAE